MRGFGTADSGILRDEGYDPVYPFAEGPGVQFRFEFYRARCDQAQYLYLLRICNALGIRIQDLLVGGKKQEDEPSSYPLDRLQADELFAGTSLDERQWLYKYRYLPDVDQKKVQDYMVQLSIERWGENYDSCRYAETEEKGDWDADGGEALKDVSDI